MLYISGSHSCTLLHEHALHGETTNQVLYRAHADKPVQFVEHLVQRTGLLALRHRQVIGNDTEHILLLEAGLPHESHEALALLLDRLVEDTASLAGVAEILVATQVQLFELAVYGLFCLFVYREALFRCKIQENLCQLVGCIVVEMDGLRETTLQAGIGVDEVVHLVGIASNNTDELTAVVLQSLQQGVNSLSAEDVAIVGTKGVGLINEQDATQSRIYELIGLYSRLTTIAGNKFRAVGLHQLTTADDAKCLEDISHDTGNRRLTRTRIAGKDIMLTLEGVALATANLQIQECCQIGNFFLDRCQAHQAVEFLQAFVVVDGLRLLVRHISCLNGHQLLIRHRGDVIVLQTLRLFLAYLVKQ